MGTTDTDTIEALDLAALLCSRVCHDLISPVGAIVNGLEVLEDEDDAEMQAHAMALIRQSATQASAKLQFARLAFGAAGSAGAEIDLGDARRVADGLFAGEKAALVWTLPAMTMAKNQVKLLLNMLLIAHAAIPRGGEIVANMEGEAAAPTFRIIARGEAARLPEEAVRYLGGNPSGGAIDARGVQPFFTGLIARELGMAVRAVMAGDDFEISAALAS